MKTMGQYDPLRNVVLWHTCGNKDTQYSSKCEKFLHARRNPFFTFVTLKRSTKSMIA